MTQEEINKIKYNKNTIFLENNQYVALRHIKLKSIILIDWEHEIGVLTLTKVTNKNETDRLKIIDVKTQDFLILNSKDEGHERVFRIIINEYKEGIDLVELHDKSNYSLELKIVDQQ